ncbi:M48 family metalloprotease [Radiobacillus sp. PE A8.2]|uniref:M48 family metalloprotease n=1 Tax=Radiobacillus sp. PE A8.2 TaxID=3380349 RepID=UPI003890E1D9
MKKVMLAYVIYLLAIWSYFLYFYPLETYSDSTYAALAHAVFFSKLPLEWILLYSLIKSNWASAWIDRIEHFSKKQWLNTLVFAFVLVVVYEIIQFPFNFLWYQLSLQEGTSIQPFADWIAERGLDLVFFGLMMAAGIYVVRLLLAKFKTYWWLFAWLLALPVVLFVIYVQPVWIDPLYEEFTPMEEGPLRTKIEDVAANLGLEDATLLQVNMSEKVTTFNAYVTGIMGNARIVLWDTTLNGMNEDEILFILAHEIGHYVKHHVYIGVAGYLLSSFVLLFVTAIIFPRVWLNWHGKKRAQTRYALRSIPLLLLILSILLTATQPISLFVSRQIELSADRYAIENTKELQPAVESFRRLAIQSKSDINPISWVKWMRWGHPTIKERIQLVEKEIEKRETKATSSS